MEAEVIFGELCIEEPGQPLHWLNRCACLKSLKYVNLAKKVARHGYSIHPNYDKLRQALCQCYAELGEYRQTKKLLAADFKEGIIPSTKHMFNIQFMGEGYNIVKSQALQKLAVDWEERQSKEKGIGYIYGDRIKNSIEERKIRIGYFSTDFCNHPVGRFLLPVLEKHNSSEYEIYALNCGNICDEISKEIRKASDKWLDIYQMNDIEAARAIADLKLDILVEEEKEKKISSRAEFY